MKSVLTLLAVLAVAMGVLAIVYGGADDSPGGQLIGVAFVVGGVVLGMRALRRSPAALRSYGSRVARRATRTD